MTEKASTADRQPLAAFGPAYEEPYGEHVERCLGQYRRVAERFIETGAALFDVDETLVSRCVETAIKLHDTGKLTERWQTAAAAKQGPKPPAHAALGALAVFEALDRSEVTYDLRCACTLAVAIHHADTGLVSDVIERPDTRAVFDGLVADDGAIRWNKDALAWVVAHPNLTESMDLRRLTIDGLYEMAKTLRLWSRGTEIMNMQARRLKAAFIHHLLKIADFRAASERTEFGGPESPVVRTILHGGVIPAPRASSSTADGTRFAPRTPARVPGAASSPEALFTGSAGSAARELTTLRVPETGFEDLNAKIAFGLAWLCLEADAGDVAIIPTPDGLRVQARVSAPELATALEVAAHRYLAAETLYQIPGVQAKYRANYLTVTVEGSGRKSLKPVYKNPPVEIWTQTPIGDTSPRDECQRTRSENRRAKRAKKRSSAEVNFTRDTMCGHIVEPFGGSAGLIMAASPHAGKPYERDRAGSRPNLKLCALCGSAAVLGVHSASLRGLIGDAGGETVIITPIPDGRIDSDDIAAIFAAQKTASGARLAPEVPLIALPLVYLAQYRHIAELLTSVEVRLHVVLLLAGGRGSDRLGGSVLMDARPQARFIVGDPFNAATVLQLIRGKVAAIEPLVLLNEALTVEDVRFASAAVRRFCRVYHGWSGYGVFGRTAEFLLKEVANVDQDIRESTSIRSVGRLLRYFVEQRKYNYVDAVRQARNSDELLKGLKLALREARTRVTSEDGRHDSEERYVPLPTEEEVLDLDRLCVGDEASGRFEQVKTALVVRSLSRQSWTRGTAMAEVSDLAGDNDADTEAEGDGGTGDEDDE